LSLRAMLKALDRQIQVAQCVLRGYLTVEMDIFVAVQTTEKYPSALQLEACVREAEKIASLVNMQSPRIVSELSLSSLTLASVVHVDASSAADLGIRTVLFLLPLLLKLL
jgi:reversion-inducing cysteine-rich kazal motif protein